MSEPLLSLRTHIEEIEKLGELRHVRGAHWDLELGAIAEVSYGMAHPPAVLFDEITGYRAGLRVLTGSTGSAARLARTLRLGTRPDGAPLDDEGVVDALRAKPSQWAARARDFPVLPVGDAPLLANERTGDDVDLLAFPVPRWHSHDGGRFVGTGCFVVTSDPETGTHNGGCYRMEVQDEGRSTTIAAVPGKHGAQNIASWLAKEGRAPVAVSFGHDPLLLVLGGTEVPRGVSELEYAGAVAGERAPVVTMPDTGLPVPAGAEIAVEGWLTADDLRDEGPFGEWTGYYSGRRRPCLNLRITRLYHRDDPILLGAPPGKPPHDYSYMRTVMKSAMIHDELVSMGVAGVTKAWAHESGGGRLFVAVSISQRHPGHARQVAHLAAQCPAAAYMNRYVVVVDDDIDVADLDQVIWAMSTRSDPARDIEVMRQGWGSKLDPMLPEGETAYNSRAIIDATIPWERREDFPRVAQSDPAELAAVRRRWASALV
ncbi:UbiD family decarboxylase [Pseudonocardia dioxanivorans CB1190]|uniref:UbiD family decarboxylase n=1 Tax=Pseudonocardia dioxanivorans (strain ATCC 55486 / DSM 44775 / JCM 13855 / CB1190) TaxID=675635 RepID=F4CJR2_PSEUX|nr:UbiD family decarboxylase [Pseudonocardia dioxanivorans]AEA25922.1 UbiD family decarboxylase [Pseudonocardia dioxanivorans CB1190]